MKTVTMLEFRRNAQKVLRRVAKGERLVLSHRGRPAARLEPLVPENVVRTRNRFFTIGERAQPSPRGPTDHRDIDRILYGGR